MRGREEMDQIRKVKVVKPAAQVEGAVLKGSFHGSAFRSERRAPPTPSHATSSSDQVF